MPRLSREVQRSAIMEEVLRTTNKPRFCYMGYAPPLCIGDEYVKPPKGAASPDLKPPMLVSAPSALFSKLSPLCIGDKFVDRGKNTIGQKISDDRPKFRPSGPLASSKLEYVPSPPLEIPRKNKSEGGFFVPVTNSLFHPKIEYMSNLSRDTGKRAKQATLPPFIVPFGNAKLFSVIDKQAAPVVVAPPPPRKKLSISMPAFRPAGHADCLNSFPEYMPPNLAKVVEGVVASDDEGRPAWKCASVPVVSNPMASVALNRINLAKAFTFS